MAKFIQEKDGTLINVVSLQNVRIDPNDDTKLLFFRINGQILIEQYNTSEEASSAYNNYKTAMIDTEGATQKELKRRISELSNTVAEQQGQISSLEIQITELEGQISALEDENTALHEEIDTATDISDTILEG